MSKHKKIYCVDCKKLLSEWAYGHGTKRCRSCAMKKRFSNPENHPNYDKKCSSKTRKKISVSETGKIVSLITKDKLRAAYKKRCINSKSTPNYKDGRTLKKYYCPDCNVEICYKSKRCMSCTKKKLFKNKKNSPNYKNGKYSIQHYCVDCDIKISSNAKRCRHCAVKFLFKIPKNCPNYIDGTSGVYPRDFNDELKYKIRRRDNFQCQYCFVTEHNHLIREGRVLHIHHIDYNKFNLNELNLITLCISCNSKANSNREFWKIYYTKINKMIPCHN